MQTFGHFIGGTYVEPVGGRWLDSSNPYTGEPWARIPQGAAAMSIAPSLRPRRRCAMGLWRR